MKEGQILFDKLNAVVTRYLKTPMEYLGCVPQDPQVVQAVMQQVPVSIQNPGQNPVRHMSGSREDCATRHRRSRKDAEWQLFSHTL